MINLKEYFNWQVLLIIIINIFLAFDFLIGMFLVLFLLSLVQFIFNVDIINLILYCTNIKCELFKLFLILFTACLYLIKVIILPILYSFLEKKSNNLLVQKFILNLKNNKKLRTWILLLTSIPLYTALLFINRFGMDVSSALFILAYVIFFGLFNSYAVLFLWWFLMDRKLN